MPSRFCTFASGSGGNCSYVNIKGKHYLIDAGISGKRVYKSLAHFGIESIDGIFITHEHSDHISGAGIIARRFNAPVYASPLTWRYLLRHKKLGVPLSEEQARVLEPGRPQWVDGAEITAFDVPHDASQPVGYSFSAEGIKITLATDIGHVTDNLRENLRGSHILLLESNHDLEMLKNGKYPKSLKDRVLSPRGHLSNAAAGALLAEIACGALQHVFLGHLSEENNRPLIALDTVQNILECHKISVGSLTVAERHEPGEMAVITP